MVTQIFVDSDYDSNWTILSEGLAPSGIELAALLLTLTLFQAQVLKTRLGETKYFRKRFFYFFKTVLFWRIKIMKILMFGFFKNDSGREVQSAIAYYLRSSEALTPHLTARNI